MDPHLALCHSEEFGRPTPCACGRTFGVSELDGFPGLCLRCAAAEMLPHTELCAGYDERGCGEVSVIYCGVTVARVRYAAPGEADGGLVALARFMVGAAGAVNLPPPSAEGYYHHGTYERRGDWTRPSGPFHSAACATVEALCALADGAYVWE